jgi:hypothetical protein
MRADTNAYRSADAVLRSFGVDLLDEDVLKAKIQLTKQAIDQANGFKTWLTAGTLGLANLTGQLNQVDAAVNEYQRDLDLFKKQSAALYDFDSKTRGLFTDSYKVFAACMKLIKGTSKVTFDQNGYHLPDGTNLSTLLANLNNIQLSSGSAPMPEVYDENGQYGGYQGDPANLFDETYYYQRDPNVINQQNQIMKIVRKYHPDWSRDRIIKFLGDLAYESCGYTAMVNTFFEQYQGTPEEFEAQFGFPEYVTDANGNKQFNYDAMIVDLYASEDNKFTIAPFVDAISPPIGFGLTFGLGSKFDIPGAWGPQLKARYEDYMKNHGVKVTVTDNLDNPLANITALLNSSPSTQVTVTVFPMKLINPSTMKEKNYGNDGHVMTVTGTIVKNGKTLLVVSSWGDKYYLDPNSYKFPGQSGFSISNAGFIDVGTVTYD